MSSASPSPTLPSANDVLLASPLIGPAVCTPSLRSHVIALPARSVSPVRSLRLPSEAPTVQSLQINPEIEILPQLSGSLVAPTTAPLTCAPSLTERALRSQRRDALRDLHDAAIPFPLPPVHLPDTESRIGAQTEPPSMQPITARQTIPIHSYSNSHDTSHSTPAACVTTHIADHLPFTVRTAPLRDFPPLAPLRASSSTMPSTTTSATSSPQKTTTASPAHTAPLPLLDFSPTPSPDPRANTGSKTGRTPGLRPAAPLPRTFPLSVAGPPPHLDHWANVWDTLTAQQRADLARPSIHEVEEGLARTHVAASAATDPDRHAIDLGTAEHDRVAAPLLSRLSVLRGHRATAHTALLECQARVTAIDTQERSTAAALSAEKRRHASFLSWFSDPPPASANMATIVAPPSHSLPLWAPPRLPRPPLRCVRPPLQLLSPQGLWHPLSALSRHGTACNHQPPESVATVRPPHSGRSWHAAHPSRTTGLRSGRLVTSSYPSPNTCLETRPFHRSYEFPSRTTRQRSTGPCSTSPVDDADSTVPWPSRRRSTPPSATKS